MYGKLTKKQVQNANEALRVGDKLFEILNSNPEASEEVLEAVGGVLLWFAESTRECAPEEKRSNRNSCAPMLDRLSSHPRALIRKEALRWILYLFEPDEPEQRYYVIKLCSDKDPEVAGSALKAMEMSRLWSG